MQKIPDGGNLCFCTGTICGITITYPPCLIDKMADAAEALIQYSKEDLTPPFQFLV